MEGKMLYSLPELEYSYDALSPYISEEQLRIHHDKHHATYVNGANALFKMMDKARDDNEEFNPLAVCKELSFHIGGHMLHSLFWRNLAPHQKGGGGEPTGAIEKAIKDSFGSFDRFKSIFNQTALLAEGGGWVGLSYCVHTERALIMQIEKHNVNLFPKFPILMVLDMWEHGYYIDYKNEKAKYVEGFWHIVKWDEVNCRLEKKMKIAKSKE